MKNLEKCKKCIHYRPDGLATHRKCIECVNDQGRMPWYTPRQRTYSLHPAPPSDIGCSIEAAPCEEPVIVRIPREETSPICDEAARPCGGSPGYALGPEPEVACDPGDTDAPRLADALRTISEALGIPACVARGEPMREAEIGPDQCEDAERVVGRYAASVPEPVAEPGCTGSYDPGCGGGY